jgi:hypothetical protein
MQRTVSLWIRSNGMYVKPVYTDQRQTRLKAQDGQYYLRYAGRWEAVGSDPLLALDAKASKEKLLRDVERGTLTTHDRLAAGTQSTSGWRLLDTSIKCYLSTGKAAEKDWRKHTIQCYTLALDLFRKSCSKEFVDEIDGDDLRSFKVYLRQQETSARKKIAPRTVYNHFNNVVSFLNSCGRRNLVSQNEWPTYEEKEVVSYEPEVVERLLECADVGRSGTDRFCLFRSAIRKLRCWDKLSGG